MDIQTERIWVLGANHTEPRSGTMVFSDDDKRDAAYHNFHQALREFNSHYNKLLNAMII